MFRWIASLSVVVFPACVLLVGDWAVALLLLPALGGLVAAARKDTSPLGQSEKLLYLAMAIFFIVAAWDLVRDGATGDVWRVVGILLFILWVPAYLWLRAQPPVEGVVWAGLVVGAVSLVAAGVPVGVGWARMLENIGFVGLVATLALLFVPARHYVWALRHRFAPLRRAGAIGLILVAMYALASLVPAMPVFERVGWIGFYLIATSLVYGLARHREREHFRTPVQRKQTLSVTVICKNEADRIRRCLDSVHEWADEIIVLDSGSTDGTVDVVKQYTEWVWVTDWPGYGPQKQRALEKANCDWVLSIDADEEVTPELRHDIDAALSDRPDCVAYKLPWGVITYGKLLDFGQSARAPLRLFVREGSRFTDDQVHETIVPPAGPVGRLRGRLLHHALRDFGHHAAKVAQYGWLGAQKRFAAGRRGGGVIGASLRSLWVFFVVYVIRLGFLDGPAGFVSAAMYAQVNFNKYTGLWSLWRERRG